MQSILYLFSGVCFILTLKGLASPASARRGNILGVTGMLLALMATFCLPEMRHLNGIILIILFGGGIGTFVALRIKMTAIPQMVAAFHSLVGLGAVLVAFCTFLSPQSFGIGLPGAINPLSTVEMSLGLIIGAITFSGSIIAFLKLQGWMRGAPIHFPKHQLLNILIGLFILTCFVFLLIHQSFNVFLVLTALSFFIGFMLILPIGGADMPVIISMLNSYSGWATAGIGFTLNHHLLVITGALVGASGAILSYIMCVSMNRSLLKVMFGGMGVKQKEDIGSQMANRKINQANGEDVAFLLHQAKEAIIVPGYGMAVAQAQHAIKELADKLISLGVNVRFAIHPVAGRMPGHMNVLLAEANIPYDKVFEQSEINRDFANTDVVLVIGANDITNPAARTDTSSPIYGMPILDVDKAKTVVFLKRSLSSGYAGVDNHLFYKDHTRMAFGDAKDTTEAILDSLEQFTK